MVLLEVNDICIVHVDMYFLSVGHCELDENNLFLEYVMYMHVRGRYMNHNV